MKKKKYDDYQKIVNKILESEEFKKRKQFEHHRNISVYDHSFRVSLLAYKISSYFSNIDSESVAIGALLHDFYSEPWKGRKEKSPFFKQHGFTHARIALENSYLYFPEIMNSKIENIILRHMFPLNIMPPKYIESWLVSLADKYISIKECLNLIS